MAGFAACEAVDVPASDLQIAHAYCEFLGDACEGVTCSRKTCSARKGEFRPSTDEVTYVKTCASRDVPPPVTPDAAVLDAPAILVLTHDRTDLLECALRNL